MSTAASCQLVSPAQLWSAAPTLSPRVKRLQDQYRSFYERDYTNEARAFSTGAPWDAVYSIWSWTNVPEVALFQRGFRFYLWAAAAPVELPDGFWNEPLVVRQALWFTHMLLMAAVEASSSPTPCVRSTEPTAKGRPR